MLFWLEEHVGHSDSVSQQPHHLLGFVSSPDDSAVGSQLETRQHLADPELSQFVPLVWASTDRSS